MCNVQYLVLVRYMRMPNILGMWNVLHKQMCIWSFRVRHLGLLSGSGRSLILREILLLLDSNFEKAPIGLICKNRLSVCAIYVEGGLPDWVNERMCCLFCKSARASLLASLLTFEWPPGCEVCELPACGPRVCRSGEACRSGVVPLPA